MTLFDYSPVTEKAGDWVTPEAVAMVYTRYRFAADFCRSRRVLEVACGSGVGLDYLRRSTDALVGGDLTQAWGDLAEKLAPDLYRITGRKSRFLKLFGLRIALDQVEAILDVWYGFVGSNPHLLSSFVRVSDGQPDTDYLGAVRKRFAQWNHRVPKAHRLECFQRLFASRVSLW